MNVCTIIAKNYAAHARVLARSFRAAHPDGTCTVLVVDDFQGYLDPAEEPFELLGIDEIGLPDPERMAIEYDVTELSTAVKPWLLRHLLDRGIDSITYLDPDIWIAESLAQVATLAREHGVVLTPHFTAPLPRDGLKPSEEDILIAGSYNLGFISLGAGETADELLAWWSERLERHCIIDPPNGLFVDQRWIDLVPGIWSGVHVLRDPTYNIAYWNLACRRLEHSEDGYLVDGERLRFFHFSGFDARRPGALSKHQNRIEVADYPALSRICAAYAEELLANGFEEAASWPYGWSALPDGLRLDRPVRRLYREAREEGKLQGSVLEPRGAERFLAYLCEASEGQRASRYAHAVRDSRADLREAFPDIDGRDAVAFERWLCDHAESLAIAPRRPWAESNGTRPGVNLVGYLSSERGVGEAARLVGSALAAREVPTAPIDIPVEEVKLPAAFSELAEGDGLFDVNVVCVNADMVPGVVRAAPEVLLEGRHSTGLWFWEVERFPERWHGAFDHLDEVWTASEFVAEALRPVAPIPVETIRIPVTPGEPGKLSRADLSMPDGFCFLFIFDYRSVIRRKNPMGLLEAFTSAFEPGEGASLMIKSIGAESFPEQQAVLEAAAAQHPDVRLLDGIVSAAEKNAMIANCDCYVSLHRSEGLGLTMAEAMYFGKPVIATGYSGNLDFMTAENSYLVDHALSRIGEGSEPYPAAARWAEPRLEHAVEQMRAVFEDREEAARRGQRAAEDIRSTHSPEAAGAVLEERMAEVGRRRAAAHAESAPPPLPAVAPPSAAPLPVPSNGNYGSGQALLHHLLRFEQPPARTDGGPLRRFAKRVYMRLLRPYSSYQRRIDVSVRDTLDALAAELVWVERRLATANEASVEQLREALADVDGRLRSLDADARGACVAQADDLEEAAGRLQDLEAAVGRLKELEGTVGRLEGTVAEGLREASGGGALLRQSVEALESGLARLGTDLDRIRADADATFVRDRSEVDGLRARVEDLVAATEAGLGALRSDVDEAARATRADAATPYMADRRLRTRKDPVLGSVIGFDDASSSGSPGGYRGFEELFRGPEEMIRERQEVYVPLVAEHAPVLDAGCGRGEFLDLLKGTGIKARGVDLDPGMVARCEEKGHDVAQGDLLEALEEATPGSLGCVFSAQVVEHLDAESLQRFLELSASRLREGGRLIVETVNPHCAEALKAFWVDPTHHHPLFPETLLALCQLAGFSSAHAFCPVGNGDWEADRLTNGEYAIVATAASGERRAA